MQIQLRRQMNALILFIIGIPLIEIYLMIKVGGMIGAFNTIFLILFTAVTGVFFARLEGFRALRSGFNQLVKNEVPIYEMISGAAIAFAAFLLILPGFATDFIGFLLLFPFTRKLILSNFTKKNDAYGKTKNDLIEGQYEDIDEDLK